MSTPGKTTGETEHLEQADGVTPVNPKPSATVDTIHHDEALKVLASYDGESTWTAAEEDKLRRKIDWMLMPVLCMTYGLQYYDKAMLSQAVSLLRDNSASDTKIREQGFIRTSDRPRFDDWRSILLLSLHILPRLHRWSIPGHGSRPEVSRGTCCVHHRHAMGAVPTSDHAVYKLQGSLCTALFSGVS